MPLLTELYLAHPFWSWMALAAALLAIEVATGSGYLLWAAASSAATALVTGLKAGLPVELVVFALLSVATTFLAKRYMPRPLQPTGPDINDPALRIVGHRGQTAAPFAGGHGRVLVDGKEWAAELEMGGDLPAGSEVQVLAVLTGARLKVRPA